MARKKIQASNASSKTNDEIMNMLAAINKKGDAMSIAKPTHQVNVVNQSCETCGGPHSYFESPASGGFTHENVYATSGTYNMGGNGTNHRVTEIFSATVRTIILDHPVSKIRVIIIMCKTVLIKSIKIKIEQIMVFKIKTKG